MDNEWKRYLRREASLHHMCDENRESLSAVENKADAIALYKKTIDWALEEGYPSMDVLIKYFSDCEEDGIFINKVFHGETLTDQNVYVFHNCRGQIRVGLNVQKRIIPMLYFANNCAMRVLPCGPENLDIRVPLYVFGRNEIAADKSEAVSFRVYNFDAK